jgi:hypothetical protein
LRYEDERLKAEEEELGRLQVSEDYIRGEEERLRREEDEYFRKVEELRRWEERARGAEEERVKGKLAGK